MAYMGKLRPKGVYSQASVILMKGPKRAKNQSILWLYKDKKTFWFSYLFNCIRTAVKEMQCPPPGNGVLMYHAD